MKIFDKPLSECPKCGSDELQEKDTHYEYDVMWQMIQCNDCFAAWEERWVFASTVVEDMEEDD